MLTAELVKAFWAHMQNEFGSSVEQKNDSALMEAVAGFLEMLSIQDKETFLKDFVTTLGRTIYIPFELGADDPRWPLWNQVRVCVHEHQHIVQGEREGWAVFDSRYLTSSSFRAGYEAEAYGCDMEMEWWHTGQIFDIAGRAAGLKAYGCSAEDIAQAEQALTIRAGVLTQGGVSNLASLEAIAWLEANVTGLRIA